MKVLSLVLLWICAIGTKTWEINEVEDILGRPVTVLIDSESNSFVITEDPNSFSLQRLFKFDPEKKLILEVDVTNVFVDAYISKNDDFYLISWSTSTISTVVNIIRAGSLKWETIAVIDDWVPVYIDNDGNLIYNAEDSNVYLLKYNTTEAVKVQNLEDFTITIVTTDKKGDTYLASFAPIENGTIVGEFKLAVITAESKLNTPEGVFINEVLDNATSEFIYDLQVSGNDELLIGISNGGTEGALKKYLNNTVTTLLSKEVYQYYGLQGNDKITLISSCDYTALVCRLSYLTLDGEIVEISNLLNKTTDADHFKNAFSEEGNIYLSHLRKVDQSSLEFLNYTDTKTIPIEFNSADEIGVSDVLLDGNDDLWVLTNGHGLFYLEKGSLSPEQVPGTEDLNATAFTADKRTNEIFALSENRLFIVTK